MKKLFVSIAFLTLAFTGNSQVIFDSDFSTWTDGVPNEFLGPQSTFTDDDMIPIPFGAEHGTMLASMSNMPEADKLFTTISIAVVGGESYKVQMWVVALYGSEMRTGFYDDTNAEFITYNDYLDIGAETGEEINLVTQTITIPSSCTSGEFIFSIRNTDTELGITFDSLAIEAIDASELIEDDQIAFSIYPNPANDIITLNVNATALVTIYSIDGAVVYTANGNVTTIDVSAFDAGVYEVVVTENETTMTERLIVR
ncbi:MAG: T9SS type A sorting domain-containing protein [Crocinitomix sp.]|nr:T9SS type A sorting domain-containing protein [Crocinitomix sp.]